MHFDLIKKTSDELNAAALQTNVGDNLFKSTKGGNSSNLLRHSACYESTGRTDFPVEEHNSGFCGENESSSNCTEDEESLLKSQIKESKKKMKDCCCEIWDEVFSISNLDLDMGPERRDGGEYRFN
eukprot:GHVP01052248.1.p2 GENE.GHVP01052248.1~~GHVP01052248.1.p2  ORF type:complete len:126 (+),score=23.52 GHVP01052248.1:44-421(+)